jgi:hypothetical protein
METILGLCIGIGLSAACGFRVFVPLLVMSLASILGWFEPMQGFEWLSMPSVCIALAIATVCEIAAYYIPWVDNALDTIATPAAMVAGTLTTMAVSSGEMSVCQLGRRNYCRWRNSRRCANEYGCCSRGFNCNDGGVANPLVSTVEWVGAVLLSVLSLLVPVLVVIVGIILAIWAVRWFKRKKQQSISTPL